jgi:hypothetical protein
MSEEKPMTRAGQTTIRKLDNEVRMAGFRGYDGCEHLTTDRRGCPTPFLCSERGDCTRRRLDA